MLKSWRAAIYRRADAGAEIETQSDFLDRGFFVVSAR
jgi:hypothetical protein